MAERALADYHRIHLIGVGGAGMSGLAKLLAQLGHDVTGSDLKPGRVLDALGDLGIDTWLGHRPDRMQGVDLVVRSSAVPSGDAEVVAATATGIPVWERPELLALFTASFPAIGFSGTHGKTTSTALAVAALTAAGHDPTFLVGGQLVDANTGAHLGEHELFVLEADEAFGTFRRLTLRGLMVTNIEADHLDYYETIENLEAAFAEVADRTQGPVIICADDPAAARLAARTGASTYGTTEGARWRIVAPRHGNWEVAFRLEGPDAAYEVTVPRPGLHIARNAAGVLATLGELGYDVGAAAAGLESFGGVRRRYEVRARIGGVTVVDDYAHHPTEIEATLDAASLGSWRTVWAVFQPHRYSRTAELADEFGSSLARADRIIVTDVYSAGEAPEPGVSGNLVARAVEAAGGTVEYVPLLRDVPDRLLAGVTAGDLVMLLGAGDITGLAEPFAERLGKAT